MRISVALFGLLVVVAGLPAEKSLDTSIQADDQEIDLNAHIEADSTVQSLNEPNTLFADGITKDEIVSGWTGTDQTRIVGGSLVGISRYPSMAALLRSTTGSNFRLRCGGTIVNAWSIVTAAHCVFGDAASRWRFRVGSANAHSGGRVVNVARIRLHPSYRTGNFNADLAILRASSRLVLGGNVRAVGWASSSNRLVTGNAVFAAGWGATRTGGATVEALRHVQLTVINQDTCRRNYATHRLTVNNNMVCAGWSNGGRDQCHGDSGGPLLRNGILVGVCSFGRECGLRNFPGVNTRISVYGSWLTNNIFRGDAASRWRFRVGSANAHSGGRVVNVARIRLHPSYRTGNFNADLAILRASSRLVLGGNVRAVGWASSSNRLVTGNAVFAAGWGATRTGGATVEALRHVQLTVINQDTCRRNYATHRLTVNNNMVCAGWSNGGRDQCHGDSGGPLLRNGILVGVCSFGRECGLRNFPGVNTRISVYGSWLTNNIFR